MALAIEGDAEVAAPFERRQVVPTGEARHVDHPTPWPRYLAAGIQDGGRRRRQIRVPIRVAIFFGLGRTPYQAYRDPYKDTLPYVAPHLTPSVEQDG
jgi:hypothetical protein